eukprot:960403-Pleurochrysis_carterae.AAC.1
MTFSHLARDLESVQLVPASRTSTRNKSCQHGTMRCSFTVLVSPSKASHQIRIERANLCLVFIRSKTRACPDRPTRACTVREHAKARDQVRTRRRAKTRGRARTRMGHTHAQAPQPKSGAESGSQNSGSSGAAAASPRCESS